MYFLSGEHTRLACCLRRLAGDLSDFFFRISAGRRKVHATARALPGTLGFNLE